MKFLLALSVWPRMLVITPILLILWVLGDGKIWKFLHKAMIYPYPTIEHALEGKNEKWR